MLDYNHNVLLASDVAQFAGKRNQVGEELKTGKLDTFYALFNLAQKRRFERYTYALSLLEKPMNFTGNGTIDLDRSKAPWPKDKAELDSLWDAKVTYDELNLADRQDRQRNPRHADQALSVRHQAPDAKQQRRRLPAGDECLCA